MLCRFSRIQILVAVRGIFAGAVAASTLHLMTGNALTQAQIAGTIQRSNPVIASSQLANLDRQIGICQPHLLSTASQQGSGGISTGHSSQIKAVYPCSHLIIQRPNSSLEMQGVFIHNPARPSRAARLGRTLGRNSVASVDTLVTVIEEQQKAIVTLSEKVESLEQQQTLN